MVNIVRLILGLNGVYPSIEVSSSTAPRALKTLSSLLRLSPVKVEVIPVSPVLV